MAKDRDRWADPANRSWSDYSEHEAEMERRERRAAAVHRFGEHVIPARKADSDDEPND